MPEELKSFGIVPERSAKITGHRAAGLILDPPAADTHMHGIDDYCHVFRFQNLLEVIANLDREPFLHLGSFGKVPDYPVDLAETNDLFGRNVGHMGFSNDRYEMVFAIAVKADVLFDQHFLIPVPVVKQGDLWHVGRIESAENFLHIHFGHPPGRASQTVVRQVQSKGKHDLAKVAFDDVHFFLVALDKSIRPKRRIIGSADVLVSDFINGKRPCPIHFTHGFLPFGFGFGPGLRQGLQLLMAPVKRDIPRSSVQFHIVVFSIRVYDQWMA